MKIFVSNVLASSEPDYYALYNNRAVVYFKKGFIELGLRDLEKALSIAQPDNKEKYRQQLENTYYEYSTNLARENDFQKACDIMTKAIILIPDKALYYDDRGKYYAMIDKTDSAISDYTKSININPNNSQSYYNRGMAYYSDKSDKKATLADFAKAAKLHPKDPNVYLMRGTLFVGEGKLNAIIREYTKSINADTSFIQAYVFRADLYKSMGNMDKDDVPKVVEI